MTHAIRYHQTGGPEVLVWEEVTLGKPGPGEARIRHTAVGLNFVDIYNRSGIYPVQLPSGLGGEAAGVTLVNARFAKPIDAALLAELARTHTQVLTIEDHALHGGFGSVVAETVAAWISALG